MKISYKLTKQSTRTEKISKSLKTLILYNIINFRTIRNKLSGKKFIESLITGLWDWSAIYGYLKKKKQIKKIKKKIGREKCRSHRKINFPEKVFFFRFIFQQQWDFFLTI